MRTLKWVILLSVVLLAISGVSVALAAKSEPSDSALPPASEGAIRTFEATGTVVPTGTVTPPGVITKPHPVAVAISNTLHVPYSRVMELRDMGLDFGVIARVYLTAQYSDGQLTPNDVLALFQSGMGWGQIAKEYGVHPGGKGLGAVMGHKQKNPTDPEPPAAQAPDPGKKGGPGDKCPGHSCDSPGQNKPGKDKDKS